MILRSLNFTYTAYTTIHGIFSMKVCKKLFIPPIRESTYSYVLLPDFFPSNVDDQKYQIITQIMFQYLLRTTYELSLDTYVRRHIEKYMWFVGYKYSYE